MLAVIRGLFCESDVGGRDAALAAVRIGNAFPRKGFVSKIVLHRSSCGQCNQGKGRPAGHDANHARWHGPYATLALARDTAHNMAGVLIRSECKCI